MQTEFLLGYCAYAVWILSGWADFGCHARTDLPHTSGLGESLSHLCELALLGLAVVAFLLFSPGPVLSLFLGVLVIAHAIVGYIDSKIAFTRARVVSPFEQIVHSIMNVAPFIGLAWYMWSSWPAAVGAEWSLSLRQPNYSIEVWLAVLLPAAVLNFVPAVREYHATLKAAELAQKA